MQRHFSNRGEPLSEVAAAKMMAHRMPPAKSVFSDKRGRGVTPGQWKTRVPESIPTTRATKKRELKESGKSVVGPPEY
jgi:hypothetical protein